MKVKRQVSNQEFETALKNTDNVNIMRSVCRKYGNILSCDDLRSCRLQALWRTLQSHRAEFGQKFTTSLHRFTHWECLREVARLQRWRERHSNLWLDDSDEVDKDAFEEREEKSFVGECLGLLPEQWQEDIIRDYYFDSYTMEEIGQRNGYSKESARQKINKAMASLKEICTQAA